MSMKPHLPIEIVSFIRFVDRAVVPSEFSGCRCCLIVERKAAEHLTFGNSV